MISESEKQEIIDLAVEKALLLLPETTGNLINAHLSYVKQNRDFYAKHPEFKDSKDLVASVIEMIEGADPLLDYDEILKRAVPMVKERIKMMKGLDMTSVTDRPNRDFKTLDVGQAERPNPHGDL